MFKKKGEVLSILLFLSAGFYFFFGIKERTEMLEGNTVYTIAKITSVVFGPRTAPAYTFTFKYNKKSYESVFSLAGNSLRSASKKIRNEKIGKHYLVKFSTLKPKYNELILDKIVSDSLVNCCFGDSWDEIPNDPKMN